MHRFLKAIGFSSIKKRSEMRKIICDVVKNSDEKLIVEDHEDGAFAEFSKQSSARVRGNTETAVRNIPECSSKFLIVCL